jgi:transposase
VRQIAKELGHSRKTIKKAIADAAAPQYRLAAGRPSLVMGPYLETIKTWLEVDKSRPAKQRHTAHRIYVRLVSECGFTGAERTVRELVAKLINCHQANFMRKITGCQDLGKSGVY